MKIFEVISSGDVLYHGTTHKITAFSGIAYFTPRDDAAKAYARGKRRSKQDTAYLYTVRIPYSNPYYFASMQQIGSITQPTIDRLKQEGYDAAVYDGSGKEPIPEVVPFYPERVKILNIEKIV